MFLERLLLHMDDISLDCAFIFIFRIDCLQPADALLKLQEITKFKPRTTDSYPQCFFVILYDMSMHFFPSFGAKSSFNAATSNGRLPLEMPPARVTCVGRGSP